MRRSLVVLVVLALASPAAASEISVSVSRASGPSPFPAEGCGQIDTPILGVDRGKELDPSVAVNPADPDNVVAAWVQDQALGIVAAASFDGGATWTRTVVDGMTRCSGGTAERILHARLSFGPDGRVYVAGETLDGYFPDPRSGLNGIPVSSSTDGGRTWSEPVMVNDAPAMNGFNNLAAEPDIPGAAVVAWHTPEPAAANHLSRTTNGGRTWTTYDLPSFGPDGLPFQRVLAAPDGTLHVFIVDGMLRQFPGEIAGVPVSERPSIYVTRSTDKGLSWSTPTVVATDVPWQWVSAGADSSGTLTVAFERVVDGARTILLTRSADGVEWTDATTVATFQGPYPVLAVAPDGALGITYQAAEGAGAVARTSVSRDGGDSWWDQAVFGPFEPSVDPGFYQETSAALDGFASIFVAKDAAADGPSDAFVVRVRLG